MKSQGFERLKFDHSVFIHKKKRLIVFVYVNDLLILESKRFKHIQKLKNVLNKRFTMTNLDSCHHYLSMKVIRDRVKKTVFLSQFVYIQKILVRFDIKNCKSISTSMKIEINFEAHENYKVTVQQIKKYQVMIDFLIYL